MARVTLAAQLRELSHCDALDRHQQETCTQAAEEIERLRREMAEQQRDFQQEARDIAAEAFWNERERHEGGY